MDYKPVSLEEYNQSLRDSVNAYYTHVMNDPTMSTEDALKSTGEVAENYLEAVEAFELAQNNNVENTIEGVQETQEVDNGTTIDHGNEEVANEDIAIDNDSLGGEECEDSLDI